MPINPPAPPYVGPAAHAGDATNKPIRRIVIHSTVSPCEPGGARAVARYFKQASAGGSAHYVVDPRETVQVVYDSVVAFHAPPNANSIGIELCDYPTTVSAARWKDEPHRQTLDRAALLTARLCLAYGVPMRYRSAVALKLGRHGITTHNEVSRAFGQSSHWDPGAWPRRRFIRKVRRYARRIRRAK